KDLAQAQLRTKDWRSRRDALLDTERALQDAQQRSTRIHEDIHRLERIRRVQPLLLSLQAIRQKLEVLAADGMPPLLADDAPEVFRQATQDRILIEADIRRLQDGIADTESTLTTLPVDQSLLREADAITQLNERRLQFRDHGVNLLKAGEEMRGLQARMQTLARELGWPAEHEDAVRQRMPASPARAQLHRLIREHGECRQTLKHAETALESSQRLVRQAEDSLNALSVSPLDERLHHAVDRAQKFGDHEATLAALQQRMTELARRLDSTLAGMGAWQQPAEALAGMLVPEMAQVRELIEQQRQDASTLQSQQAALDTTTADIRQLEGTIAQLLRTHQPVSRDDVQQARDARNRIWQGIRHAPASLPEQADAFETHLQKADELADARVERAQHEAERQARQER
ncbi:MAG: hypothetical protein Q4C67_11080, partial [Deinococcus sp.]|nr:hypothetical protein [Deinococcus sp.]